LVRLPSSIASLTELTTLYLGENRLPEMPLWVGGLGKLRILDVSYNGLTPYEIETLMRNLPKCQITH
jgi:Leucine-rich repeat (LRR) protein